MVPEDTLRYLEDTLRYLDIEARAVSIRGLMKDKDHAVQLLIDEDVLKTQLPRSLGRESERSLF